MSSIWEVQFLVRIMLERANVARLSSKISRGLILIPSILYKFNNFRFPFREYDISLLLLQCFLVMHGPDVVFPPHSFLIAIVELLLCLKSFLRETSQFLDSGAERRRISTLNGYLSIDGDLFAILEEEECRHGGDSVGAGDVLRMVYVHLGKGQDVGYTMLCGKGLKDGRNLFAWRAPVGKEVNCDIC